MIAISQTCSNAFYVNEHIWITIQIAEKFVSKGSINNITALVQIMAWTDQATSHFLDQWWLYYWRIYASLGLNELMLMWRDPNILSTRQKFTT